MIGSGRQVHRLPSLCPTCRDRGYHSSPVVLCDCAAGDVHRANDLVRSRLRLVYDARGADFWMTSRNAAFGGERPIQLLRDGRVEEVLAATDRIPGMPGR